MANKGFFKRKNFSDNPNVTAKTQREIARAIKRARYVALLPYVAN